MIVYNREHMRVKKKKTKYENQNIQPFIPHSNANGKLDVTPS